MKIKVENTFEGREEFWEDLVKNKKDYIGTYVLEDLNGGRNKTAYIPQKRSIIRNIKRVDGEHFAVVTRDYTFVFDLHLDRVSWGHSKLKTRSFYTSSNKKFRIFPRKEGQ